jgi:uncharacterized protein (TIGR03435 family)
MLRFAHLPLIPVALACAQSATAPKDFEVVSIKPADPNLRMVQMELAPGGRFKATGVTLRLLLQRCYGVRDFQISGAPSWAGSDRYEISAKAEDGQRNITPEQISMMLRGVLTDRFKLTFHRETKEGAVYFLVPGKGGPKLKEAQGGGDDGPQGQRVLMGRGHIESSGASIDNLVNQLSNQLGRPVLDKTGLTGLYDFKLDWTPEAPAGPAIRGVDDAPPAEASGPTIFTALQETLGLKLESGKGPVEYLVIDKVEKPTEN